MPGLPPLNLYARVRFLLPIAHETAGAACIRHSLLPLSSGENLRQTSGRSCREIADAYSVGMADVTVNPWYGDPLSFPLKTVSIRNNFGVSSKINDFPVVEKGRFPNSFSCLVSKIGKNLRRLFTQPRAGFWLSWPLSFRARHPTSPPRFR